MHLRLFFLVIITMLPFGKSKDTDYENSFIYGLDEAIFLFIYYIRLLYLRLD
jgi:hypothetical protein